MKQRDSLYPGAWIGVIGGGQLGRMFALEARRLNYRTCILDPDPHCPAGQVADDQIVAPFDSLEAARQLAGRVSVVTYEFENVSAEAVQAAEEVQRVYPGSLILRVAQHRVREKQTLADMGFPVPRFYPVQTADDLHEGVRRLGLPAVLKTATSGYDGKGQVVIAQHGEVQRAYEALRPMSEMLILEEFVPFAAELSVVCARGADGQTACYPAVENYHRHGILDVSIAPARVPKAVAAEARRLGVAIATSLELVGVLAVELFLTKEGRLLVNELAPRPHNSGHYTLDGCACSQFEQLLRAVCHLPLGSDALLTPTVMVNLLGDLWEQAGGRPNFAAALSEPGVKLHLYGKAVARPGRKMGHLCALAADVEEARERAVRARERAITP